MPVHSYVVKPGETLSNKLHSLLVELFNEDNLTKLEKFGGRVQISVVAPYHNGTKKKFTAKINNEFIKKLVKEREYKVLESLTKPQLKEVCKILEIPTSTKENHDEIMNKIIHFIKSERVWKTISRT